MFLDCSHMTPTHFCRSGPKIPFVGGHAGVWILCASLCKAAVRLFVLICAAFATLAAARTAPQKAPMTENQPIPPVAALRPHSYTRHGTTVTDPYFWLKDQGYPKVDDPDIIAYLNAENAYHAAQMKPQADLVETLFEELKGRIKEDESSVPQQDGAYIYWRSFEKGAQYRKWMRKPVAGGPDEIIIDEPALAKGHDYFELGSTDISDDDRLLAYSTDTDGSERFTIRFRDLVTGKDLPDAIPGTNGGFLFARDGKTLLYGQVNDKWRVDTIKAHVLGTATADDKVIYHEADQGFQADVGMTQSRKWITIATGDNVTSEIRLLPADNPFAEAVTVRPRQPGVEYSVEEHDGTLFIHTNDTSPQFRLVTAPLSAPSTWTEKIAPSPNFYMTGVAVFAKLFVVEGRNNGLDQVIVHDYAGGPGKQLQFAESAYVAGLDDNPEYDVAKLRLSYESMVTPDTVYDYDLATGAFTTLKVQEIPSGYDASNYATERVNITARDGTNVPVSVVYKKGFKKDGTGPLYLYGYGAYGIAIPPGFSTRRFSLLDRGFAYAIAHIRGGDDLGQQWQLDGKLTKRTNAFNDFVDSAKGLIDLGFTKAGRIVAAGASAGGELMGVVVNTDPALWGAVAAHVPFVDVLNTMQDESLPLTPGEWPEWGNPISDKAAFDLIRSYSPYDQVKRQTYPPMLVTAGINDPRVTYWEPAKWVARLRAAKTDQNVILLKTNMNAGHGGKTGRFESLRDDAEEFAFFLWQLGMTD
jgi:oligopeptidase B